MKTKKLITLIIAVLMVLQLTSCSSKTEETKSKKGFDISEYRVLTEEETPFTYSAENKNNLVEGQTNNETSYKAYTFSDLFEEFNWTTENHFDRGMRIHTKLYFASEFDEKIHGAIVLSEKSEEAFNKWEESGNKLSGLPELKLYLTYRNPEGEWLALPLNIPEDSIEYPVENKRVSLLLDNDELEYLIYKDYSNFFWVPVVY